MPYSVECFSEVYEVVEQIFLMLEMFFHQELAVEDLFHSAPARTETCLFLGEEFFCFGLQSIQEDAQQDFTWVADETDRAVILAFSQVPFLWQWYD